MASLFSDQEASELERLLRKVRLQDGWWPTEASVQLVRQIESTAALELVILRKVPWGSEVLLRKYKEGVRAYRDALSFPGGYIKGLRDVDKQAACTRIARAELGVNVKYVHDFGISHLWGPEEHPDKSRAFSCYVLCTLEGELTETENLRFFSRKNLPTDPAAMVQPHREFILKNIF